MNASDERHTLQHLLKAIENPSSTHNRWIAALGYGLGMLGIVAGYLTAVRDVLDVRLAIAFAGFGGVLIGIASYYSTCQKQSQFVMRHFSIESIRKRLRELDI